MKSQVDKHISHSPGNKSAVHHVANESCAHPCGDGMALEGGEETDLWLELDTGAQAQSRGSVRASACLPANVKSLWEPLLPGIVMLPPSSSDGAVQPCRECDRD